MRWIRTLCLGAVLVSALAAQDRAAYDRVVGANLLVNFKEAQAKVGDKKWESMVNYITSQTGTFINYLTHVTILSGREKAVDQPGKQQGAASGSPSGLNLASSGSLPMLLNFAVENGGLTQSVTGTTSTFRGNAAEIVKALAGKPYWSTSPAAADVDALVRQFYKLSFSVSLNTNQSEDTAQKKDRFSGFSTRYEIWSHRDPRRNWTDLTGALVKQANVLSNVLNSLAPGILKEWREASLAAFMALHDAPSEQLDAKLFQLFHERAILLQKAFPNASTLPDDASLKNLTEKELKEVADSITGYTKAVADLEKKTARSPVIAAEVIYNRQFAPADTTTPPAGQPVTMAAIRAATAETAAPATDLPGLVSLNLIAERYAGKRHALTANFSSTFFRSLPAGSMAGRLRDLRLTGQWTAELPENKPMGKGTFSLAGTYLNLREEPLGEKVMIDGKVIDRKGHMGVVQGKISFPLGDTGIRVPLSVSWASRTELLPDPEWRAQIGITFDFDKFWVKGAVK